MFPEIPMQPHDIFMDKIITEQAIYAGKGRVIDVAKRSQAPKSKTPTPKPFAASTPRCW